MCLQKYNLHTYEKMKRTSGLTNEKGAKHQH